MSRYVWGVVVLFALIAAIVGGALVSDRATDTETASARQTRIVNVYSARHYGALEKPFTEFTEKTGIEVRLSQGTPQQLLERLRAEGDRTPADVFLAIDAGVLALAAQEGLLQPIESEILTANIPETMRDPENRWFALSARVRTIVYNPEKVDADELSTYAALADPKWKDRLCLRPAAHIYTISLVSSLIHNLGAEEALAVVEGWVANNPRYIDSDTRIIETIAAGGCDVGLVNHYYLARLLSEDADYPVSLFWANQGEEESGAFFNVNGAGITANARNYDSAVEFIEYFSTLEAQSGGEEGFPGSNYEYPANPEAEPNEVLIEFGEVKLDLDYSLWEYGDLQDDAIQILEDAGYGFEES